MCILTHLHVRDVYEADSNKPLWEILGEHGAVISVSLYGLDHSRQDRGKRAAVQGRSKGDGFSTGEKNRP